MDENKINRLRILIEERKRQYKARAVHHPTMEPELRRNFAAGKIDKETFDRSLKTINEYGDTMRREFAEVADFEKQIEEEVGK